MGKITDAEILAIIEIISVIQKDNVGHPCLVRLNSNTWEFLNLGDRVVNPNEETPRWVATFQSRLRSVGCTISQDSVFWKEVYATASWSPYHATHYNGTFRGPGAALHVFGVLEKHLLREKLLDAMLLQHDQMKSLRKELRDAMAEGYVDGDWLDQIISPGSERKDKTEENEEDAFDWSDVKNNPTARGKTSISYLPMQVAEA